VKKVYQSRVSNVSGDCLRACVASILELPLEAVPNWLGDAYDAGTPKSWHTAMLEWLMDRGVNPVEINFKDLHDYRPLPGVFCIASLPSKRFDGSTHAVVGTWVSRGTYTEFVVAHDPNPGNGLYPSTTKPSHIIFLVPAVPVLCDPG